MQPTLGQRLRAVIGDGFGADVVEQNLEKAIREARERVAQPEAVFYDPMSMFMGSEWLQSPNRVMDFYTLRAMAKNPIIGSIVQTRINQVAAFCQPKQSAYDQGFKIVAGKDSEAKEIKELTQWIYTVGLPGYGEASLETFIRKFMRDSLVLDQACAEVVFRRNGQPAYMVAVDSATIRKLPESLEYYAPNEKDFYCQIVDEQIVARFTQKALMFGVRNPQTDLPAAGYGFSELEILVRVISSILNTDRFNASMLQSGGTAKGIMVVKGDASQPQMESFKRDFREATRNAASYWRVPVLQMGKDGTVEWIQLDRSNRDMEYGKLFDFLVKQACGVYQMDPSEINWTTSPGDATTVFEAGADKKQDMSQKRGLRPLLTFLSTLLNHHVVQVINEEYRLEFVGMDRDRSQDAEIRAKEVTNYRTINEMREELGLEPIEQGDIILNDLYLQNKMSESLPKPGGAPVGLEAPPAEDEFSL